MQIFRNIVCIKPYLGGNISSGWLKPYSLLVVCFLLYLSEKSLNLSCNNEAAQKWLKYSKPTLQPGFTCQSADLSFGVGFFFLVGNDSLKKRIQVYAQGRVWLGKALPQVKFSQHRPGDFWFSKGKESELCLSGQLWVWELWCETQFHDVSWDQRSSLTLAEQFQFPDCAEAEIYLHIHAVLVLLPCLCYRML